MWEWELEIGTVGLQVSGFKVQLQVAYGFQP